MERVPEPELMDDAAQARAYADADFSAPHQAFVDNFKERFSQWLPRRVVDLGCGPADVGVRFVRAFPGCTLLGVDAAEAMLNLAAQRIQRVGLEKQIRLRRTRLTGAEGVPETFDTVISNSLLHHLDDPMVLWRCVKNFGASGSAVFVTDLVRPTSRDAAAQLVASYSGGEPEILQRDFFNSLLAAYRPQEIEEQLEGAQLPLAVESVSDRHVAVYGFLP